MLHQKENALPRSNQSALLPTPYSHSVQQYAVCTMQPCNPLLSSPSVLCHHPSISVNSVEYRVPRGGEGERTKWAVPGTWHPVLDPSSLIELEIDERLINDCTRLLLLQSYCSYRLLSLPLNTLPLLFLLSLLLLDILGI